MTGTLLRDYCPNDDEAARAIYEASFPPSLRAPWSDLVHHRADERFVVLVDDGVEVIVGAVWPGTKLRRSPNHTCFRRLCDLSRDLAVAS